MGVLVYGRAAVACMGVPVQGRAAVTCICMLVYGGEVHECARAPVACMSVV